MLDQLKERNTEEKKQENLFSSQKDNWHFQSFYFVFIKEGVTFVTPFFLQKECIIINEIHNQTSNNFNF